MNYFFVGLLIFGTIFVKVSHQGENIWLYCFVLIVCLHNLLYSLVNKEARVRWVRVKKSEQPELYGLVTLFWFIATIVAGFFLYEKIMMLIICQELY